MLDHFSFRQPKDSQSCDGRDAPVPSSDGTAVDAAAAGRLLLKKHHSHDDTFQQRYFVCDGHWRRPQQAADGAAATAPAGPIFFYLGNEADVLLYLNNTGACTFFLSADLSGVCKGNMRAA